MIEETYASVWEIKDENSVTAFIYKKILANSAKNYDLLRVIAVHGTMTIKFYMESLFKKY